MSGEPRDPLRRVVFVADDLGVSAGVNDGIEKAARSGLIKETSLCVTGAAVEDGVSRARALDLNVGLHLSLTLGRALSGPIKGLTGTDGSFRDLRHVLLACMLRTVNADDVRREIEAQIDRAQQLGIELSHLNGHHHVHCFPIVRELAFAAARQAGVQWIRVPAEHPAAGRRWQVDRLLLRWFAGPCRRLAEEHGLRYPNFLGLTTRGDDRGESRFASVFARLPGGDFEWMVHPRIPDGAFIELDPRSKGHEHEAEAELSSLLALASCPHRRDLGFRAVAFRDLVDSNPARSACNRSNAWT